MSLALSLLLAPLALDGESVNNNNTAIAAVSLVSIIGGFLLLGALWYFVFRAKAWDKDNKEDDPPQPPRRG
jgi:uncharacterized membrane protein (GlpM family)